MEYRDWIVKLFKMNNDTMVSKHNIAYAKIRCQAVANEVRERLGRKGKYEAGEILICRLYRNDGEEGKFNVNIRWVVLDAPNGMVRSQDVKNDEDTRVLNESVVDNHFRYAYCATCHSRQGTSLSGNITIHEWNRPELVSSEWLWCAITGQEILTMYIFTKIKRQITRCLCRWLKAILK